MDVGFLAYLGITFSILDTNGEATSPILLSSFWKIWRYFFNMLIAPFKSEFITLPHFLHL